MKRPLSLVNPLDYNTDLQELQESEANKQICNVKYQSQQIKTLSGNLNLKSQNLGQQQHYRQRSSSKSPIQIRSSSKSPNSQNNNKLNSQQKNCKPYFLNEREEEKEMDSQQIAEKIVSRKAHQESRKLLLSFRHLSLKEDVNPQLNENFQQYADNYKNNPCSPISQALMDKAQTKSEQKVIQKQCWFVKYKTDITNKFKSIKNPFADDQVLEKEEDIIYNLLIKENQKILQSVYNPNSERIDNYFFPILSDEHLLKVGVILEESNDLNMKINFQNEITIGQIRTLKGLLNDIIINSYLELISKDLVKDPKIFNTYFYQFLTEKSINWKKIARIVSKKQINFQKDVFYIPMNMQGKHWVFCEVNCEQQNVYFFDSLVTTFKNLNQDNLPQFLHEKLKNILDMIEMMQEQCNLPKIKFTPKLGITAIQQNTYSCGIFMLKGIHYKLLNYKITFTQQDIEYFQKLMTLELLQNQLT